MKTQIKTPGAVCGYSGKGRWGYTSGRQVGIKNIKLSYVSDDGEYGELRVFFKKSDWKVEKHGLIYTDQMFLREFKNYCTKVLGLPSDGVGYTEQGAQGDSYVSIGVGKQFLKAWAKKTGEELDLGFYQNFQV